ncbi:MAG: DUF3365 domain-containing protein [Proteobacteria bacterium]|nr:DUF3365 domain-containing protein [Pseudomonadota bacterium]
MNPKSVLRWLVPGCVAAAALGCLGVAFFLQPVPAVAAAEPRAKSDPPVVVAARERAALAHVIYSTTMEIIHRHYFRKGQAVLPARAMEDVFAEVAEQSKVEGSWIAVNTKAMSIHHEPKTDFEKQAANAIAEGKEQFESIDKDYYRSARAIPLGEGCVNCHTGMFRGPSKTPRYAGLVISIPLK